MASSPSQLDDKKRRHSGDSTGSANSRLSTSRSWRGVVKRVRDDEQIAFDFVFRSAQRCRACCESVARVIVYKVIGARPLLFFITIFIIACTVLVFGLGQQPPDVETDLESMLKADANSTVYYDAFKSAKASQAKAGSSTDKTVGYRTFDLVLGYENSSGSSGVLGFESIYRIRGFERKIRELSRFSSMCALSQLERRSLCDPGISFANYLMPAQNLLGDEVVPRALKLNGNGMDAVPVSVASRLASMHGIYRVMLPTGAAVQSLSKADFLRTVFRFSMPLGDEDKLVADWKDLVRDVLSVVAESELDVYITGDFVQHLDVIDRLKPDMLLAIGSYSLLLAFFLFYTRSVMLSFGGILVIAMSLALAYSFFALVGTKVLSISCFMVVFFMAGLGSDPLLTYRDAWMESSKESSVIAERFSYTYRIGGKNSLVSSLVMTAAFFSCLVSVLRPLRDLCMFLGCTVVITWILSSLLFVPLCAISERCSSCNDAIGLGCFKLPWTRWLESYTKLLNVRRVPCIAFFELVLVVFFIITLVSLETNMTAPNVFPDSHNQNRGVDVFADNFQPLIDMSDFGTFAPPVDINVCVTDSVSPSSPCDLFWCDVKKTKVLVQPPPPDVTCSCTRKDLLKNSNETCPQDAIARHRFAGLGPVTTAQIRDTMATYLETETDSYGLQLPTDFSDNFTTASLSSLMQYDWGGGVGELTSWTETTVYLRRKPGSLNGNFCGFQELCWCGSSTCELSYSSTVRSLSFPMSSRRLDKLEYRRLSEDNWQVPERSRIKVIVAFGLQVKESTSLVGKRKDEDLWSFSDSFAPSNLQAQRDMKTFCREIPDNLRVVVSDCWIARFEAWLLARGEKFPAMPARFPALLKDFATEFPLKEAPYLWVVDDVLKAAYFEFSVDVDRKMEPWKLHEYMELWDEYVGHWNANVASPYVRGAFHVSEVWTLAESHSKMMHSMAWTVALICGCVFAVVFFFTTDLVLPFYALLAAGWSIWSLCFSLLVLVSWDFGPIQVMILDVFTGWAFVSAVHVVQKFRDVSVDADDHMEERYKRVSMTLTSIGCVVMGTCVSTVCSAIFMLPCALRIFSDMGAALLLVPILATLVTMVPLAALLLWLGPVHPGTLLGFHCFRTCSWKVTWKSKSTKDLGSPPSSPSRGLSAVEEALEAPGEISLAPIPENTQEYDEPAPAVNLTPSGNPTRKPSEVLGSRPSEAKDSSYSMDSSGSSSIARIVQDATPRSEGSFLWCAVERPGRRRCEGAQAWIRNADQQIQKAEGRRWSIPGRCNQKSVR